MQNDIASFAQVAKPDMAFSDAVTFEIAVVGLRRSSAVSPKYWVTAQTTRSEEGAHSEVHDDHCQDGHRYRGNSCGERGRRSSCLSRAAKHPGIRYQRTADRRAVGDHLHGEQPAAQQ